MHHVAVSVLLSACFASLVASLDAAEPISTPATEFIASLAAAPGIAAARVRLSAAESAQGVAGLLPDPVFGVDAGRKRFRAGQEETMYGAMIEQPLPRWGTRDAERQQAQAEVLAGQAMYETVVGEHAAVIATALASWMASQERLTLMRQSRARIDAMRAVVAVRLAAGGAGIAEQLLLDTRAQQLDLAVSDLERRALDDQAEIRSRLGLQPEAAIPPCAAPDPATITGSLTPLVRAAAAATAEARASEMAAQARGRPETAIGLTWEREAAQTDEQSDQFSLNLRVSLPVHRAAYGEAADAARWRARASRHEAAGAAWMAESQVGRATRAQAQAVRAEASAEGIAARTHVAYEAMLQQIGSGGASVTAALDLLDRVTESGIEAVLARLDGRLALADLWRLAPPVLNEPQPDPAKSHHPNSAPVP